MQTFTVPDLNFCTLKSLYTFVEVQRPSMTHINESKRSFKRY